MHALLLATILLTRTTIRLPADMLSPGRETARATDLLRAKRMADEAAGRLQTVPRRRGGWERGGGGWERGTGAPDAGLPTREEVR
jgi:hypothetical protein